MVKAAAPLWNWDEPNARKMCVAVFLPVPPAVRMPVKGKPQGANGVSQALLHPRGWPPLARQPDPGGGAPKN